MRVGVGSRRCAIYGPRGTCSSEYAIRCGIVSSIVRKASLSPRALPLRRFQSVMDLRRGCLLSKRLNDCTAIVDLRGVVPLLGCRIV